MHCSSYLEDKLKNWRFQQEKPAKQGILSNVSRETTLAKAIEGTKTIKGILKENNETSITVEGTEEIIIPKDKIKSVNLEGEI